MDVRNASIFGSSEGKAGSSAYRGIEGGDMIVEDFHLMNDALFKVLFGTERYKHNLEKFLSDILRTSVGVVKFINTEQNKGYPDEKTTRLDILAELGDFSVVNIEVQVVFEKSYIKRVQYYWAKEYCKQLSVGESYSKLKKVIHISILADNLFSDAIGYRKAKLMDVSSFESIGDEQEYHFLETKKVSEFYNWAQLFKGDFDNLDEDLSSIYKEARIVMSNPGMRSEYEASEKRRLDELSRKLDLEEAEEERDRVIAEKNKVEAEKNKVEAEKNKIEAEKNKIEAELEELKRKIKEQGLKL